MTYLELIPGWKIFLDEEKAMAGLRTPIGNEYWYTFRDFSLFCDKCQNSASWIISNQELVDFFYKSRGWGKLCLDWRIIWSGQRKLVGISPPSGEEYWFSLQDFFKFFQRGQGFITVTLVTESLKRFISDLISKNKAGDKISDDELPAILKGVEDIFYHQ